MNITVVNPKQPTTRKHSMLNLRRSRCVIQNEFLKHCLPTVILGLEAAKKDISRQKEAHEKQHLAALYLQHAFLNSGYIPPADYFDTPGLSLSFHLKIAYAFQIPESPSAMKKPCRSMTPSQPNLQKPWKRMRHWQVYRIVSLQIVVPRIQLCKFLPHCASCIFEIHFTVSIFRYKSVWSRRCLMSTIQQQFWRPWTKHWRPPHQNGIYGIVPAACPPYACRPWLTLRLPFDSSSTIYASFKIKNHKKTGLNSSGPVQGLGYFLLYTSIKYSVLYLNLKNDPRALEEGQERLKTCRNAR